MMLWLLSFGQTAVLDEAVTWMNENNLTIFKTVTPYKPNNYIRRDEAAKLFVNFAKLKNKDVYVKTAEECKFSDLNDAHKDLKDIIVESCRMGIFQWANGKFMPRWSLTNEQAVTILVRTIDGPQSENNTIYSRADNYYTKAYELWLLKSMPSSISNRKIFHTRWDLWLLLYGSYISTNLDGSFTLFYEGNYWFSIKVPNAWSGYEMRKTIEEIGTTFAFWFEWDPAPTYSIVAHSLESYINTYGTWKLCELSDCLWEKTLVWYLIKQLQQHKNYLWENKEYIFTYWRDQRDSNQSFSQAMAVRELYIPNIIKSFQVYK